MYEQLARPQRPCPQLGTRVDRIRVLHVDGHGRVPHVTGRRTSPRSTSQRA